VAANITNMFATIVYVPDIKRVPVSRRDRPAKPPLSREVIVAVAVRLLRDEGLERVTMRRLAHELDTGPASLYVYVQNTAELHGAVLDELLAGIDLRIEADAGSQPSLARSVLALRPSGPNYLRLIDTALALLGIGGVPTLQAAWGVDLLLQQATATAAEHGTRHESPDAETEQDVLALVLREVSETEYPSIARAGGDLVSGTGRERLRWAFEVLIGGIATTGTTSPTTASPAAAD